MTYRNCTLSLMAGAALSLAACGGGGGDHVNSTPAPAPTPPPPPPPPPPPTGPLPPAHIGLVSSAPFSVQAVSGASFANVQFRYDAANDVYLISLPGFQPGYLDNIGYNGSAGQVATGSTSQVSELSFGLPQAVFVTMPVPGSTFSPFTYTSFGLWAEPGKNEATGYFAYGIPTLAGDVPVTGSASYDAVIHGSTSAIPGYEIGGSVDLQFNFGAGTLSGSMHPQIIDGFDGVFVDFGRYDFSQTVYSVGSTTFSGSFIVPGLPGADSSFEGNFTGPGAAELMARFQTPFVLTGQQGTMSGIWIGKKN